MGTLNGVNFIEYYKCVIDILSCIFTFVLMVCGILGVVRYWITDRRLKIEKANELAKYYKDYILDGVSALCHLYKLLEVDTIIEKLDISKMNNFDEEELTDIMQQNDISTVEGINKKDDYISKVLSTSDLFHLNLNGTEFVQSDNKRIATVAPEILKASVNEFRTNIMNSLEYFSMNFTSGVADEKNVYLSLSPSFIDAVKYLYVNIARKNKRAKPQQLFTNVSALFKIWRDKVLKDKTKYNKAKKVRKINKI